MTIDSKINHWLLKYFLRFSIIIFTILSLILAATDAAFVAVLLLLPHGCYGRYCISCYLPWDAIIDNTRLHLSTRTIVVNYNSLLYSSTIIVYCIIAIEKYNTFVNEWAWCLAADCSGAPWVLEVSIDAPRPSSSTAIAWKEWVTQLRLWCRRSLDTRVTLWETWKLKPSLHFNFTSLKWQVFLRFARM